MSGEQEVIRRKCESCKCKKYTYSDRPAATCASTSSSSEDLRDSLFMTDFETVTVFWLRWALFLLESGDLAPTATVVLVDVDFLPFLLAFFLLADAGLFFDFDAVGDEGSKSSSSDSLLLFAAAEYSTRCRSWRFGRSGLNSERTTSAPSCDCVVWFFFWHDCGFYGNCMRNGLNLFIWNLFSSVIFLKKRFGDKRFFT